MIRKFVDNDFVKELSFWVFLNEYFILWIYEEIKIGF